MSVLVLLTLVCYSYIWFDKNYLWLVFVRLRGHPLGIYKWIFFYIDKTEYSSHSIFFFFLFLFPLRSLMFIHWQSIASNSGPNPKNQINSAIPNTHPEQLSQRQPQLRSSFSSQTCFHLNVFWSQGKIMEHSRPSKWSFKVIVWILYPIHLPCSDIL